MDQKSRTETLDAFKTDKLTLLIASDVAARGLDIPAVSHVFNFDVPTHAEDYIHRIGRTGRAGRSGTSITLVTPSDGKYLDAIQRLMQHDIPTIALDGIVADESAAGRSQRAVVAPDAFSPWPWPRRSRTPAADAPSRHRESAAEAPARVREREPALAAEARSEHRRERPAEESAPRQKPASKPAHSRANPKDNALRLRWSRAGIPAALRGSRTLAAAVRWHDIGTETGEYLPGSYLRRAPITIDSARILRPCRHPKGNAALPSALYRQK